MTMLTILGTLSALLALFLLMQQPVWTLLHVPRQAALLWQGQAVRRNHAIEHATVNVLEARYGQRALDGFATHDGFRIRGAVDPALLLDAAREALARLQRGDRALAVLPRCSTTLVGSFSLSWLLVTLALLVGTLATAINMLLAALLAALTAPMVSTLLQRWLTTSMDVKGMSIGSIELLRPRGLLGMQVAGAEFVVCTRPARRVVQPPYRYGDRVYVPVEVDSRPKHR